MPVTEPVRAWWQNPPQERRAYAEVEDEPDNSTALLYFRRLVDALPPGVRWNERSLLPTVERWLNQPDHYRFVASLSPRQSEWLPALRQLGLAGGQPQALADTISTLLTR